MSGTYFEEFLTNPKKVAEDIRAEMAKGEREEELTQEEKEEIEEAMKVPLPASTRPGGSFVLRGEGGSGQVKRDIAAEIEGQTDAFGRSLVQVKDEEADREEEGEDGPPLDADSIASRFSSDREREKREREELKAYCESMFGSLNSLLVSLSDRLARLEAATTASIPITKLPGSPPRVHGRTASVPTAEGGMPKGSQGRGTSSAILVSRTAIVSFLRENPSFPSMSGVRRAKLMELSERMGGAPVPAKLTTSDWTEEGLYKAWTEAAVPVLP